MGLIHQGLHVERDSEHTASVGQLLQSAQQRSQRYPNACLIIQVDQPLAPSACLDLLKFLQNS